jgi:hypothetical protein
MSERYIANVIGASIAFGASYAMYRTAVYLDLPTAWLIGIVTFVLGGVAATLWAGRYPD